MLEPLRIQQIRQFLLAAEHGSFRAAAAATFRSAAAVSTAMKDLERQIGSPLFEDGQRATLTPLARVLRPLLAELLSTHDRVLSDARQMANAEAGSISIAIVPFLAEEWFPPVLMDFLSLHPGVTVKVTDERSWQIRNLVAEGAVDIGICARLIDDTKLNFQPIAVDTFGIGCAASHPFARRRAVTWRMLAGERLIANDAFETLNVYGLGERIGRPAMSISSRPSLMKCLRDGVGITVLPRLTKPEWAEGVTFVPLAQPKVTRQIGIMTRHGQTLLPIAGKLIALMAGSLEHYAERKGAALWKPRRASKRRKSEAR